MSSGDETRPSSPRKKARKGKKPPTELDVNQTPLPTDHERLDAMTREHVQALEKDKRLIAEIKQLRARLDQLAPENARFREALSNAESNNFLSTVLIALGGSIVSYATFTGNAAPAFANAGAGCLLAGIFAGIFRMCVLLVRDWRRK